MSATVLNRIGIVLATVGAFIAGALSMAHLLKREIPCGLFDGCQAVAQHPTSFWFSGTVNLEGLFGRPGIPVAVFGFAMYLTLLVLAAWRRFADPSFGRLLLRAGFGLSLVGTVISIYLQYISASVIREWCTWCIASAITITLLFFVHALEMQAETSRRDAPARPRSDLFVIAGFGLALLVALGFQAKLLGASRVERPDLQKIGGDAMDQLLPDDLKFMGDPKAPVTILEFGDLNCGMCQRMHPLVKDVVAKSKGKVRWAFRHFPLYEAKPYSLHAALLAEYASEYGKFWEYLDEVYALDHTELRGEEPYFAVLSRLGLDPEQARRAIRDTNSKVWDRVYRDRALADRLGLEKTPAYFVIAPGLETMIVPGGELLDYLEKPEIKAIIEGHAVSKG